MKCICDNLNIALKTNGIHQVYFKRCFLSPHSHFNVHLSLRTELSIAMVSSSRFEIFEERLPALKDNYVWEGFLRKDAESPSLMCLKRYKTQRQEWFNCGA